MRLIVLAVGSYSVTPVGYVLHSSFDIQDILKTRMSITAARKARKETGVFGLHVCPRILGRSLSRVIESKWKCGSGSAKVYSKYP